jgi:hypothetical protein
MSKKSPVKGLSAATAAKFAEAVRAGLDSGDFAVAKGIFEPDEPGMTPEMRVQRAHKSLMTMIRELTDGLRSANRNMDLIGMEQKTFGGFQYPLLIRLAMKTLSVVLAPAWIWMRVKKYQFTPEDKEKTLGLLSKCWDELPAAKYITKEEVLDAFLDAAADTSIPPAKVLLRVWGELDRRVDKVSEDELSRTGALMEEIMGGVKGGLTPEIQKVIEDEVAEISNNLVKGICELANRKK